MLRCSAEAYAKCPTRHSCGSIATATFVEGSECDEFNRQVMGYPLTNADKIRAMSDEELCNFIMDAPAIPCDEKISAMMKDNGCNSCEKCVMDWLRKPVKEESK